MRLEFRRARFIGWVVVGLLLSLILCLGWVGSVYLQRPSRWGSLLCCSTMFGLGNPFLFLAVGAALASVLSTRMQFFFNPILLTFNHYYCAPWPWRCSFAGPFSKVSSARYVPIDIAPKKSFSSSHCHFILTHTHNSNSNFQNFLLLLSRARRTHSCIYSVSRRTLARTALAGPRGRRPFVLLPGPP